MKTTTQFIFVLAIAYTLLLWSGGCRKNPVINDPTASLTFSTDTLTFDTVFTSIGSATRLFKVFNPYKQAIIISNMDLAGGNSSAFRMNVDGIAGIHFNNIQIAPEDSLYVFVEVTVDPNSLNTPFVISDSILFMTNGNQQKVKLLAYGQNAHFYNGVEICNETWTNDKPYVMLGTVMVDTGCSLNIEQGVKVYMHGGAHFLVAGTLNINGTPDSVVSFEGDRLEHFFDDLAGQWGSIIILRGSTGSVLQNLRISEATSGIVAGSSFSNDLADFTLANKPDITLSKVLIKNCRDYGVFSFLADVDMENCLIYGCGENDLALLYGGIHNIRQSTLANFGVLGLEHKVPVLLLSNYAVQNQIPWLADVNANFTNDIFYGSLQLGTEPEDGEISIDTITFSGNTVQYLFDHCLVKTNLNTSTAAWQSILKNQDPLFVDATDKEDFSPSDGSPLINAGTAIGISDDFFGQARIALPDIGAIEKTP